MVLLVVVPLLPSLHPRMASEARGPTVTRQLEPPGRLALHYGASSPLFVLLGHAAYGLVLGALYKLPGAWPPGRPRCCAPSAVPSFQRCTSLGCASWGSWAS